MKEDLSPHFLITIDVEDWFQVENFKPWVPFDTWTSRELRVERNVHALLDLFDSFSGACDQSPSFCAPPKATFFVLGWLAGRLPGLVREIFGRGHEVASHGLDHELGARLSLRELKSDLSDSKKLLEDITGAGIKGYRAPSFAVDDAMLKTIQDCGYLYDSSFNSFALHGRYGHLDLSKAARKQIAVKISDFFFELPISNIAMGKIIFPWGGGGYFRLIPFWVFRKGVESIIDKDGAYLFYMHPWEIDPDQPRVEEASFRLKFRHYTNLKTTLAKLERLVRAFDQCRFVPCSQYLDEIY